MINLHICVHVQKKIHLIVKDFKDLKLVPVAPGQHYQLVVLLCCYVYDTVNMCTYSIGFYLLSIEEYNPLGELHSYTMLTC